MDVELRIVTPLNGHASEVRSTDVVQVPGKTCVCHAYRALVNLCVWSEYCNIFIFNTRVWVLDIVACEMDLDV